MTIPYPPTTKLTATQNLICEEVAWSGIGASDTCEGKKTWGVIREVKTEHMEEGMRVGNSDQWIHEEAWDKPKIKFRRDGNTIYTQGVRLIKKMQDKERKFTITNETNDKFIAYSFEETNLSTSTATLLLDKSKGLLFFSNTYSKMFCNESLLNYTTLYSCK